MVGRLCKMGGCIFWECIVLYKWDGFERISFAVAASWKHTAPSGQALELGDSPGDWHYLLSLPSYVWYFSTGLSLGWQLFTCPLGRSFVLALGGEANQTKVRSIFDAGMLWQI
jgi:hypothetical protein